MIAAAALFLLSISAIFFTHEKNHGNYVEILRDNEILFTLDLATAEDSTIKIECGSGYNIVEISGGKIRISEADCPDKTCVKSGFLEYDYLPVVCLPHHLVIRFSDGEENEK